MVRTGPTRLRLVPRLERSRPGTLFARERRLRRWIARGSRQWEPGSGIHAGLPAFAGGNALGAKHGDELQGTDCRRKPDGSRTPFTFAAPAPSSSRTCRACFCGPSLREIHSEWPGSSNESCRFPKTRSRSFSRKSPPSSPSATSTSASSFWNALNRSARCCRPMRNSPNKGGC